MSSLSVQQVPSRKSAAIQDALRLTVTTWDRVLALRESSLFDLERDVTSRLLIAERFADWAEKAYAAIAYTQPKN